VRENKLRKIWGAGDTVFNSWLAIPDSFATETMAHQGYDSLTVDMQHGLIDEKSMISMLQAISTTETVPIVRVPWLEPSVLMKTLDVGAYGVICPMINTAEDARRFVAYTSYAPRGKRSFGPIRALLYGGADYAEFADETIVRFAMIETAEALENLDAILSVEGLDAIYVGPSDLSLSLGYKSGFDDVSPTVQSAIEHIAERARAHGIVAGIHNGAAEVALARIAMGYRFVTVGSDARFMAAGAKQALARLRQG
jgi:4-hydroxy-2-oxoheptanedioate aldolase